MRGLVKALGFLLGGLIFLVFAFPLYWMVITSLKSDYEIGLTPPTLFPQKVLWVNWSDVWVRLDFLRVFQNSLFVALTATFLILLVASLAAFVLSKREVSGSRALLILIVLTMVLPPAVLLLPLSFLIERVGLKDNLWGLVLPFAVTPFGIFFLKQYIDEIPNELIESAEMDGGNDLQIFFVIVLPLLLPALATLGIIEFVNNWNSFTVPLVLIKDTRLYTIPLKIYSIAVSSDVASRSTLVAANSIAVIPIILFFLIFQRGLVSGIMRGAVKG